MLIDNLKDEISATRADVWEAIPNNIEFSAFTWQWIRDYCRKKQDIPMAHFGTFCEYVAYFDEDGNFHACELTQEQKAIMQEFVNRAMLGEYPELVHFIINGNVYEVYSTGEYGRQIQDDMLAILKIHGIIHQDTDCDVTVRYR